MSKQIQGVDCEEFDVVGGFDDLERYLFRLIREDGWEIPDCFLENHSIWDLVNTYLEPEGYLLVLQETDSGDDGAPGMSFGHYGLRLDKPRHEVRDFARQLIMDTCQG